MRLTHDSIYNKFLRNIQSVGVNDSNLSAEFDFQLGSYYQLMLAKLKNYKTYMSSSFTTVLGTQYYANPPGYIDSDGITMTIGSLVYPLKLISSQYLWEQMNVVPMQAAMPPQFYFPRRDDFGVWPIPRGAYTGTVYYHYRDRNLHVSDYQAGSIAVTSNSAAVVGTGTNFTAAMIGRWFTITDTTVPGQGYFYRVVAVADTTHLTLFSPFSGTTSSGVTGYLIAETPEIPEDLHMYLVDGITGGYYKDIRKDPTNAQLFLNSFWTGDMNNPKRDEGDADIAGGLIGGMNSYNDREDERVIDRRTGQNPYKWEPFAVSISSA